MWQQPIYDRTKADVSAGADKCYINAALLNRLEGNSAYLAELLGPKIQTKTWVPTDLLTRSEMERILQNIQTLRDAYYTLPGTPALPETPSTLYSDINTMEQVQWSMYELWRRNAQHSYTEQPYFGWKLKSEKPNTMQAAYRLRIYADDTVCFDSGRVETACNAFVCGPDLLRPQTFYRWAVTVWDNHGENTTAESSFETSLSAKEWKADWMRTPRAYVQRKKGFGTQPPATLFRRAFTLSAAPRRARLSQNWLCQSVQRINSFFGCHALAEPIPCANGKFIWRAAMKTKCGGFTRSRQMIPFWLMPSL